MTERIRLSCNIESKNWNLQPLEIGRLQRVLVISAHQDDAEMGMAGTIHRMVRDHHTDVKLVVATDGGLGFNGNHNLDSEQLIQVRRGEQEAAAAILGISEIFFLGYPDQGLYEKYSKLVDDLEELLLRNSPQAVFVYDPYSNYFQLNGQNHPDHRVIGEATSSALAQSNTFSELYYYLPDHPTHYVSIPYWPFKAKEEALFAHQSQMTEQLSYALYEIYQLNHFAETFRMANLS